MLARFASRCSLRAAFDLRNLAEREGFEPPVPYGTPDFESGRILKGINMLRALISSSVGRTYLPSSPWGTGQPNCRRRNLTGCHAIRP